MANENNNNRPNPKTLRERNMQAAIDRANAIKEAEEQKEKELLEERRNDGRQYEMEVEGFNIGDSLVRRALAANEKVSAAQQELMQEELTEEIEGIDDIEEVPSNTYTENNEDDIEEVDDDFELEDIETEEVDTNFDEDAEDDEEVDIYTEEPAVNKENNVVNMPKVENKEDEEELFAAPKQPELPSQDETFIDPKDLDDLELDDEPEEEEIVTDDTASKEELDQLRKAIKEKLGSDIPDISNLQVVKSKPASVNQVLATQDKGRIIDWPLMESGKLISMRSFSGIEVEDIVRDTSERVRNRFNIMREIYDLIYEHVTSPKPSTSKEWLKSTPYKDTNDVFMSVFVSTFNGSNYMPYSCENDKCKNIWLSENIPIKSHIKFKDKAAEKRFNDIKNSPEGLPAKSKIYRVAISPSIAVDIRLAPSIYHVIFENSILDPKFYRKYNKLLGLMTYIDNMYYIRPDGLHKIVYKVDQNSEVKTLKYRIASYAKIINNLSSDAYMNLMMNIAEKQDYGEDYITYQIPEVFCPKCGTVVKASDVANPLQLIFGRHRLNQLTIQY